jgi:nucleoside-diphosphate-sugar epimerase
MEDKKIIITGGSGFIGTNLVEFYIHEGWQVLNIDKAPPRNSLHQSFWKQIDITNKHDLQDIFQMFSPKYVLHFAARTDLIEQNNLSGYSANYSGVQNIIDAVRATPSIQRVIFASSQLVCRIGYQPKDAEDYCPTTLYGFSKVIGEQIIRASRDIGCSFIIVRPTSIWGPWFDIPYRTFFQTIRKGYYFHPGQIRTFKQWGFVLNTVHQVHKLLSANNSQVNGKTFYLADYEPILLKNFANMIQEEMGAREILTLPLWFMKTLSKIGDVLQLLGWQNPPLTSFRLHNIISDEIQDLDPLESVAGALPYSKIDGVSQTAMWLEEKNII